MQDITRFRLRAEDFDFITGLARPECLLAERDGTLWASDKRGGLTRIAPDGTQTTLGKIGATPNGFALGRDGVFTIANIDDEKVYRLRRDGSHEVILDSFEGKPLGAVNFVYLDDRDRLWITVSTLTVPRINAVKSHIPDGYILRMDPGGPVKVADGLCFTNEVRVSADGNTLYIVESARGCVSRQAILPDGSLGPRSVHGPAPIIPGGMIDGIAFDAAGNLWATEITRNGLVVITPEGRAHTVFEDPEGKTLLFPTSIAFGGPDLCTAWVGTIRNDRIARFRSPIPGAPLRHWV